MSISSSQDLTHALNEYKCAVQGTYDSDLILAFAQQLLTYAEETWKEAQKKRIFICEDFGLSIVLTILEVLDQDTPREYGYIKKAFRGASLLMPVKESVSPLQQRVQSLLRSIHSREKKDLKEYSKAKAELDRRERITQPLQHLTHSDSQSVLALADASERRIVPLPDALGHPLRRQAQEPFSGDAEVLLMSAHRAHQDQSQNSRPPAMPPTNG